jgi:hypothetical protein
VARFLSSFFATCDQNSLYLGFFKNISYFCLLYGHSDYLVFFLTKYTVCTEFLYDVFFH